MLYDFEPGDFLIFQLESGYALLRVLAVDNSDADGVWHLLSYEDLFLDTDAADASIENPSALTTGVPHVALTNRAFESTQVARLKNVPLTENELEGYRSWMNLEDKKVSDRSIRLLLGLR
jgi:hypothetical protein